MTRFLSAAGFVFVLLTGSAANGSLNSTGENGINSRHPTVTLADGVTPLTGDNIAIGQVESNRPGRPIVAGGTDDAAHSNTMVRPVSVALQAGSAVVANMNVGDGHATQVAGVIISTDTVDSNANMDDPRGVAMNADLHSSAYITAGAGVGYTDALLTTQYIATRPNMRAINHSWFKPRPATMALLNGNSQLTLGMDWIAMRYDVLNIHAGNQGEILPIPTDNFNGMTIAASDQVGGVYRRVAGFNTFDEDAEGDRTSISLLAPGSGVELAGFMDNESTRPGTSIAVPHVTGTVALLQQFANQQIMNVGAPRWKSSPGAGQSAPAQRHEVMKAVLMNSADKLIDNGTVMVNSMAVPQGSLLGMERTVQAHCDPMGMNCSTWLESAAYDDSPEGAGQTIPLDDQMGAGHLNARRAREQIVPGEWDANAADVPVLGWDYGNTTGVNNHQESVVSGYKSNSFNWLGSVCSGIG